MIFNSLSIFLLLSGAFFFFAGTVGLLRFKDTFSRIHALTKADNVGLGLICLGIALQSDSLLVGIKIGLIWLLALISSATSCYAIAQYAFYTRNKK